MIEVTMLVGSKIRDDEQYWLAKANTLDTKVEGEETTMAEQMATSLDTIVGGETTLYCDDEDGAAKRVYIDELWQEVEGENRTMEWEDG